jgi:hypothetical protein
MGRGALDKKLKKSIIKGQGEDAANTFPQALFKVMNGYFNNHQTQLNK